MRRLALPWARDMASGSRDAANYPGGAFVDGLVAGGKARLIAPAD
ncbi:hypothetical protein [Aquabacterium sp.]